MYLMLYAMTDCRPPPRLSDLWGSITGSGLVRLPGWDHRWVIISVVYLLVRCLTVLTRHQASKDAEILVLRHENAVLRRQAGRVRYEPGDRLWLAALSRLVPRRQWGVVFMVTPATLLAWHRQLVARKWDYASRRRPGRPSTAAAIRKLVIRMATENPAWGTGGGQIQSARSRHSEQTVGRPILAAAGFQPAVEIGTSRIVREGRLKGGCRQDCLPHFEGLRSEEHT